jgi:Uma2 family endonuclease
MEPAYKLLTVEEFLASYPNDQRHYQLIDGVIVAMAPPAIPHQIIAANATIEIGGGVRANLPNCTVRSQAGIAPQGLTGRNHFETDITVTCEQRLGYKGIAEEPLLIVEIRSPSTERDDHFVKLPQYQSLPGLQEILYIESERIAATTYRREAAGRQEILVEGAAARLRLQTIGLDVALGDIYRGVRWPGSS